MPQSTPNKNQIDLDLFVFIERYITNTIKWDILTYFGKSPHVESTTQDIAQLLGRNYPITRRNVGDLALFGILTITDEQSSDPKYRLTERSSLRVQVIKLANSIDNALADQW